MTENRELPRPVQRVVDAINDADTDAFVAAFTEDGSVDDWGRVLRGRDGVRQWAETDAIGAGAHMTVLSWAVDDEGVVSTRFAWRSRVFNGESEGIFTLSGDRVAVFRIPPHV